MGKIMVSIEIEGASYDELREAMHARSGREDVARVVFHKEEASEQEDSPDLRRRGLPGESWARRRGSDHAVRSQQEGTGRLRGG